MPASRGGKVKTFLQAVAIGLYLLPLEGPGQDIAAGGDGRGRGGHRRDRGRLRRPGRCGCAAPASGPSASGPSGRPGAGDEPARDASRRTARSRRPPRIWRREVIALAVDRGATIAVAESLTAGWSRARWPRCRVPRRRCGVGSWPMPRTSRPRCWASTRACSRGAAPSRPRWPRPWPAGVRARLGAGFGAATTGVAGPGPAGRPTAGHRLRGRPRTIGWIGAGPGRMSRR